MKAKLVFFISCFGILSVIQSPSYGYDPTCQPVCCNAIYPPYDCSCADLGVYENTCMSTNMYCAAFGNVGAR